MKTFLLAASAAAVTAWSVPALAQAIAPVAQSPPAAKAMTRAQVSQKAQKRFVRLDANRDGFVTQAEAQANAGQRPQRMQRRAAKIAERAGNRAPRRDPAEMFARFDTNRDGQITRAEVDARRDQRAARAQGAPTGARGGKLFERADVNRDGTITRAEFDSVRGQGRQRMAKKGAMHPRGFGGRMFAMADADRDGRLSLQEATAASMQRFDSADSNRDGIVTREERRQVRQQRRGAAPRG